MRRSRLSTVRTGMDALDRAHDKPVRIVQMLTRLATATGQA
jgi:hypothetical protein